jgi:hypothetical protein
VSREQVFSHVLPLSCRFKTGSLAQQLTSLAVTGMPTSSWLLSSKIAPAAQLGPRRILGARFVMPCLFAYFLRHAVEVG